MLKTKENLVQKFQFFSQKISDCSIIAVNYHIFKAFSIREYLDTFLFDLSEEYPDFSEQRVRKHSVFFVFLNFYQNTEFEIEQEMNIK